MNYVANEKRYDKMVYKRCGNSGIKLPLVSLGLWQNFGDETLYKTSVEMVKYAFDNGITHFDLANNYGPPAGAAEKNFGKMLKEEGLKSYRDEMIISSKAGYYNFAGPYGEWGSKKYLVSSLDKSLQDMGLNYVDIFYHHRPDPETPLEETMGALDLLVRQGKALYVGISNYQKEEAKIAIDILKKLGTPCLINQPRYNMLDRWVENGLLDTLREEGVGCIPFSPLSKGLLTDRYFDGIPNDSRAGGSSIFLNPNDISEEILNKTKALNEIAKNRGQKLSQMALCWILRKEEITSVLIGASRVSQVQDAIQSLDNLTFSNDELSAIENILA
jgi:L-glyceraldehyde 3-phosphate reductase